jgi:CheY-like chemotaxis protein
MLVHDLRNLIGPIRNAVHVMRLSGPQLDVQPIADMIDRQVKDMGRLLDTLAEADQAQRGEIRLEFSAMMASDMVSGVVRSLTPLIESRGQHLRLAMPEAPIHIEADRSLLARALAIVVENAASHTPERGDISIGVEAQGDEVVMQVSDTGDGIAPQYLPHLFEFFPARDRAKRTGRTGLGSTLAIAAHIVALHGGRITATSEGDGRGSRFAIRLPASRQAVGAAATSSGVSSTQAGANASAVRRVLIADDNAALRTSFGALLAQMKHVVRAAADGAEALSIAHEWKPEFAFIDVNMPKLNGYELARQLRSEFPSGTMKLVMMSGDHIGDATVRGAQRAGFDACIDKLYDIEQLERLLKDGG